MFGVSRVVAALLLTVVLAGLATGTAAQVSENLRAYHNGDVDRAIARWETLAKSGNVQAQSVLAGHYLHGLGVPRDEAKAAGLFRQAAEQGHTVAQANLGELYRRGIGVPRDLKLAFVWLGLAARNGHSWAGRQQEALVPIMNEIDVIDGERAIVAWLGKWFPTELVGPPTVIDGNRLQVDGHLLRLVGIEAPPLGRACQIAGRDVDCGVVARAQLKDLTAGSRVRCRVYPKRVADARAARCYAGGYDLSEGMVYTGWAYARGEHAERYLPVERDSRLSANGLWRGDVLVKR